MSFELQKEHLAKLIPGNKNVDAWHAALVDVLPKYGITTERRMAHFISFFNEVDFWLLDEPTNALDHSSYLLLQNLLSKFIKMKGSILIASHDKESLIKNYETFDIDKLRNTNTI